MAVGVGMGGDGQGRGRGWPEISKSGHSTCTWSSETDAFRTVILKMRSPLNWEIGIDMYTLMCIKWMTNKKINK